MSTSGMLYPNNVIFYHPMDDFVEHTQGQTWVGNGAFVDGKIGDANSGAAYAGPVFGTSIDLPVKDTLSRGGFSDVSAFSRIDDSHCYVFYTDTTYDPIVHLATISGTSVSVGSGFKLGEGYASDTYGLNVGGCSLGGDKFVCFWLSDAATYQMRAGSISGESISSGAILTVTAGSAHELEYIDTDKCLLTYHRSNRLRGRIITASGYTLTAGAEYQLNDVHGAAYSDITRIDSDKAIVIARDANNSASVVAVGISGTVLTSGETVFLLYNTGYGLDSFPGIEKISEDTCVASYYWQDSSLDKGLYAHAIRVSGLTITQGARTKYSAAFTSTRDILNISILRLSDDCFMFNFTNSVCYTPSKMLSEDTFVLGVRDDSNINRYSLIGIINDDLSVTYKSLTTSTDSGNLRVGKVEFESSGISPTGNAYPSLSGATRVVVAMWEQDIGIENTDISIQRDYKIHFEHDKISLGPDGAIWSGSGVEDLLSAATDGEPHFLLLDFEHTESGNWNLAVSVDGSGFTDYGQQNSGTRSTDIATLTPGFILNDGDYGQWLDELVVWGGNKSTFPQFYPHQLSLLYDLADDHGEPMPNYSDHPLYYSISGHLFSHGFDIESDSIPLFINGSIGDVAKPMDWFFFNSDYYPQLLGIFNSAVLSVSIRVWRIDGGNNVEQILTSNNCYKIGDTDRWAWSTANLKLNIGMPKQFFYIMTADNNETFSGQFILDMPEEAKWIHPSDMGDYIK